MKVSRAWILLLAMPIASWSQTPEELEPGVNTSAPVQPAAATPAATNPPAAAPAVAPETAPKPQAAAPATRAPAPATESTPGTPAPRARVMDRLDLDATQITGNRELPKVLYIVPWKQSDLGDLVGKPTNSLLDEVLAPVDRDVFRRENRYYDALKPDSLPGAAPIRDAVPPGEGGR